MKNLTDILGWSHRLLGEVLKPGSLAVDLTAGNGHDTLFLARSVGPAGRVIAFDIQDAALEKTAARLFDAGIPVHRSALPSRSIGNDPGVWLAADCHSQVGYYLPGRIDAAAANLGYLPGGDRQLVTRSRTTLIALAGVLEKLAEEGRICVVAYPGHEGGREEGERVEDLFSGLPPSDWDYLKIVVGNSPEAPRLLAVQRRQGARKRT